ncbi:hypothetical protein F0562_019333 [Nyssa sinensis]|uniref:Uncharacterized protein n=1 Tax=Nyssa sinensis TaxID=561372 RepID=A0A5J4ZEC8_9ASTE|nr:hypothetical protein F0562_019333 [Nyssa sinensis]
MISYLQEYTQAKTLAEKEVLRFGNEKNGGLMEVVTLGCGLVGEEAHLSWTPSSVAVFISQLTNDANSYQVSAAEIANYYQQNYPEFHVKPEHLEGPKRAIEWGSTKLNERGFVYKHDIKMILDDCIKCARKMGDL